MNVSKPIIITKLLCWFIYLKFFKLGEKLFKYSSLETRYKIRVNFEKGGERKKYMEILKLVLKKFSKWNKVPVR